jgi:hypothetical protein
VPLPTADDVLAALCATGRLADPGHAAGVARDIAAYGSIDRAAAALANDEAYARLSSLLAFREALAEIADPHLRIARLEREASDLDRRAVPAWAEGAEYAGKAAHRDKQGERDLAALFHRRSEAAERLAADLEDQAFARRLQAAALRAALACRTALTLTLTLQTIAA